MSRVRLCPSSPQVGLPHLQIHSALRTGRSGCVLVAIVVVSIRLSSRGTGVQYRVVASEERSLRSEEDRQIAHAMEARSMTRLPVPALSDHIAMCTDPRS